MSIIPLLLCHLVTRSASPPISYFPPCIRKKMQRPFCIDRRIELSQRARRRIARIGEYLVAFSGLAHVERSKLIALHVDFAAHFQNIGIRRP